jgi:hypothetical protein
MELHLGGAGRGQPEGKLGKPRWMVVTMDCREEKRQMVDATYGMEGRLQHLCLCAMLSGQSTPSTFFHLHITGSNQKITVTLSIVPP